MKRMIYTVCLLAVVSIASAQTNADKVTALLAGIVNFENATMNAERPIANVNLLAAQQADTMFVLNKDNAAEVLTKAKNYQACVITVERHSIVRIDSWEKCVQSGSWGFCMPYGTGYVQKGEMDQKEDYINNIIGIPDSQRRTVFLFKKK